MSDRIKTPGDKGEQAVMGAGGPGLGGNADSVRRIGKRGGGRGKL